MNYTIVGTFFAIGAGIWCIGLLLTGQFWLAGFVFISTNVLLVLTALAPVSIPWGKLRELIVGKKT